MPIEDNISMQDDFMSKGGLFVHALRTKRKSRELPDPAVFRNYPQEYPKMIRISQGMREVERSTETVDKKTITWKENKEVFTEIIVNSEDEEERVLQGGKTSSALEEDRQGLLRRCRDAGIKVDLSWSAIRLRRELGEKMDAPEPVDDMAALKAKLAQLEEMKAMKEKIAALEAELAGKPADDLDGMRAELTALGVTVDKRWGAVRLRDELERATAPGVAA